MNKSCRKCRQDKPLKNFPKMNLGKYGVGSTCFDCKENKVYELKRTPVKKIGARTKARIQQNGTESALFARVWKNRPHICQVCNKSITEAKNYCFPHLLAKKNYPAYRYMENNIGIVCSTEHHQEVDKLIATKSIIEVENAIADGKGYDFIKNNLLSVKK